METEENIIKQQVIFYNRMGLMSFEIAAEMDLTENEVLDILHEEEIYDYEE